MRRIAVVLAVLLVLAAPFGEGGRASTALLILHSLTLALALLAGLVAFSAPHAGRPRGPGTGILLIALMPLALACLSAARAAYPYAAWLGIMDRLAAFAALTAAAVLLAEPSRVLTLRNAVVLSTTVQALFALAGFVRGGPAEAAALFLNRNHLAAYLNLGLFLCVAAADRLTRPPDVPEAGGSRGARLWAGLAVVHLVAILLLQSRGGVAGLVAAGLLIVMTRWRLWPSVTRRAALSALLLVVAAGGTLLSLRFARDEDPDRYTRVRIWTAAASLVRERPILGHGPGSFAHEAQRHTFARPGDPVRLGRRFTAAHSAFLTLAAEDGLPAATFLGLAVAGTVILLLRRPGQGDLAAAARGIAAGLVAFLVQGLVEDLQERPALTLTGALLMGCALAATRGWRARERPRAEAPAVISRPGWMGPVVGSLCLLTAFLAASGVVLPWVAWRAARQARASGRAGLEDMRRAARLDPGNAEYHHDLAMAALNSGPPAPERYAEAARELQEARRANRRDPRFPLLMARLEARAGRAIFADATSDARAAALYAEAIALAPIDPRPRLEHAGYLAATGRLEEAAATLAAALELEPNYRRARILLAEVRLRAGDRDGARAAYADLLVTDGVLESYQADSPYASEITADDVPERAALAEVFGLVQGPVGRGTNG